MKVKIVFSMKSKTHKLETISKLKLLSVKILFPIKNRQELEDLEELVSLKNQVEEFRLQDKLDKQNFHKNNRIVFEPNTDTIKTTSKNLTKTITETSINNNKAQEILNDKILEIMNDMSITSSYLLSPLSKITNPGNTGQFKLVKDHNLNRVKDLFIHNTIPGTLYNNLLTFCDTGKEFQLHGDLLKMITK